MDTLIAAFAVLLVFQLVGAVLLGLALRRWLRREFSCNSYFLFVWGLILGIIPLIPGAMVFAPHGDLLLVGLAFGMVIAIVAVVALVPASLLRPQKR